MAMAKAKKKIRSRDLQVPRGGAAHVKGGTTKKMGTGSKQPPPTPTPTPTPTPIS
jgi:hypothetical protein